MQNPALKPLANLGITRKPTTETSSANLGFEQKLWLAADKLRNNMDAAEYKHVVLGLIFLCRAERDRLRLSVTRRASRGLRVNYISDSFDEHHARLVAGSTRAPRVGIGAPADPLDAFAGANPEDKDTVRRLSARRGFRRSRIPQGFCPAKDQYLAANVFWVAADARWAHLQASAKQPTIGKDVDDAMVALERDNPRLKGGLPKDYARADLDTAQRDSAFPLREATRQSLSAAKDKHRFQKRLQP